MELKNLRAVLFDFDGVLADTMQDNFSAWKKAFQNYVSLKKEDYFPLEGMQLKEIAKTIAKKYNIIINAEEIVNLKNKGYLEEHKFSLYPEVEKLVDLLKKKFLLAIVSSSPREKLEKTVPNDFLKKFKVVISAEDAEKGKPNPEPYLKAIEKLRIKPEECVVIENSPFGIKSAKSAGIYCIAISSTLNKDYLKEADKVIDKISDLKRFFME